MQPRQHSLSPPDVRAEELPVAQVHNNQMHEYGIRVHIKAVNLCRSVRLPAGEYMQGSESVRECDISSLNPGDASVQGGEGGGGGGLYIPCLSHTHTFTHLLTGELCRLP